MRHCLTLILAACCVFFTPGAASAQSANRRQAAHRDSLEQELRHADAIVDSLRKVCDARGMVYDSVKMKVQRLGGSRDTALLHKWTRIRDLREQEFDSSLTNLDRWAGKKNHLAELVAALPPKAPAPLKKTP